MRYTSILISSQFDLEQNEENPVNQSLDANNVESKAFTIFILLPSGDRQVSCCNKFHLTLCASSI